MGSSPRGRGKLHGRALHVESDGLIPAWAGKTSAMWAIVSSQAAHPRVGGENPRPRGHHTSGVGSSPRGRGKLVVHVIESRGTRLIPAWAGKTCARWRTRTRQRAHPRVGGENSVAASVMTASCGSSPRGRGKPDPPSGRRPRCGLIPAWAGKTHAPGVMEEVYRAHPRVGGENADSGHHAGNDAGSSPRGRGKL